MKPRSLLKIAEEAIRGGLDDKAFIAKYGEDLFTAATDFFHARGNGGLEGDIEMTKLLKEAEEKLRAGGIKPEELVSARKEGRDI